VGDRAKMTQVRPPDISFLVEIHRGRKSLNLGNKENALTSKPDEMSGWCAASHRLGLAMDRNVAKWNRNRNLHW
jgi:hypothetical protein